MSFPRYPKYKASGVELFREVPEHWVICAPKRRIQSLAGGTLIKGACADEPSDDLFPGFSASGQNIWLEEYIYDCPAIVLSAVGARCGKAFKADGKWGAVANTHCLFPRAESNRDYLWYLTNQEDWWEKGGSAQPFVKVSETLARPWVFPPLPEQTAIAEFLDRETGKIDGLVAEQRRLIELLKEKRQAVISHAVTKGLNPHSPKKPSGIEWLGEVPEHWETRTIAKASTKITNGFVGPTRDILVESGTPYIQATHIKRGRVNFDDGYFVSPEWSMSHAKSILAEGDVLIVQTGAGTGDIGLVSCNEVGFNCHALIIVASLKDLLSGAYLSSVLQSDYGRQKLESIQTGGMHPHLNCGNVKFVEIPLPPLAEQTAIIEFLKTETAKFDTLTAEAQRAIDLLQERRTALISAAVTGQIDVREVFR
jgi:type I restriction enzyme S subunit